MINVLRQSESAAVSDLVLDRLGGFAPGSRRAALALLLSRPQWARDFLEAVTQQRGRLTDLSLDQKQSIGAHPNKEIAALATELLARGGSLPNPNREKVLEQLSSLTRQRGNAAKGKEVFQKQCAKCHKHSGESNNVGPDLSGMTVDTKLELLTQIIDPSRSVEDNYRQYSVSTQDGRVLVGLLASESRTAIELHDAEGKKHSILHEDIDELVASPKSLMPEGFEKQIPQQAIMDLLEFLTQRGKFLPIPLDRTATIVSTRGLFIDENAGVERLLFADWSPKQFAGVPFQLVNPQGDRVPNVIMLHGPRGKFPPRMPKSVLLPCNSAARTLHMLSGVSGWEATAEVKNGTISMTVRLHYEDGTSEDHPLMDGQHFADYIRRVDVPLSRFAFKLRGQQMRYLTIKPQKTDTIKTIELLKGHDHTASVVMAMAIELAP